MNGAHQGTVDAQAVGREPAIAAVGSAAVATWARAGGGPARRAESTNAATSRAQPRSTRWRHRELAEQRRMPAGHFFAGTQRITAWNTTASMAGSS